MTDTELFAALTDNGWTRVQFKKVPAADVLPENKPLEHWVIGAVKTVDEVTVRKNFLLYLWPDKSYTWQEKNPFPVAKEPSEFETSLRTYLDGIADLETYSLGKVDVDNERAFVAILASETEGYRETTFVVTRRDETFAHKKVLT